ncbi:MAG: hypothetical protein R3C16_09585 [Hyphomonadaceae bacterium]
MRELCGPRDGLTTLVDVARAHPATILESVMLDAKQDASFGRLVDLGPAQRTERKADATARIGPALLILRMRRSCYEREKRCDDGKSKPPHL